MLLCVITHRGVATAHDIAARLGLADDVVEPVVAELVAWRFLTHTAEGFAFQPDADRWGPPAALAAALSV